MEGIKTFRSILVGVPAEAVYRRLGFRAGKTSMSQAKKQQIDVAIEAARALISLQGTSRRVSIGKKGNAIVLGGCNTVFWSKNLAFFLKDCDEILLMAATAGNRITDAIRKKSRGKEIETAVIWDAVASETVDGALEWIQQYYNRLLRRENKQLSRNRYSCGYGDFLLENQKAFFRLLELKRFGVRLTKSFILLPEKSVTAIAAIKELQ